MWAGVNFDYKFLNYMLKLRANDSREERFGDSLSLLFGDSFSFTSSFDSSSCLSSLKLFICIGFSSMILVFLSLIWFDFPFCFLLLGMGMTLVSGSESSDSSSEIIITFCFLYYCYPGFSSVCSSMISGNCCFYNWNY